MKRTFRSILTLALVFLMLTALAIPAAADVIVEPNNLFYATHREECEYIRYRRYLTNSEAGYVYLYQSPDAELTVRSFPNGETVVLTWLYTDKAGEVWGILGDDSGWFRLSDLSLVYDSKEFLKDNEAKCVPFEKGSFESIEASEETPVIRWSYPGGEKEEYSIQNGDITEFVSKTYTDEGGAVWGYIGYMYGMRDFWVCLTAPYDETVGGYALPDHEITLKQEPTPVEDIPVSSNNTVILTVVGVLIAAVVIGTVVLIRVMFIKKKQK